MIKVIAYASFGHIDHGWLRACHHFSFAQYYNPERTGFGALRVINDDWIASEKGFAPHSHQHMEIITYVRTGAITHHDSEGNRGKIHAGNVQVMSAGTGIVHSEYNNAMEPTTLYQIWIEPWAMNLKPSWSSRQFPKEPVEDMLNVLVSGFETDIQSGALTIHQKARICGGRLSSGKRITHSLQYQGYLLVSDGQVRCDGHTLFKGDAAEIIQQSSFVLEAIEDAEVLVIDIIH